MDITSLTNYINYKPILSEYELAPYLDEIYSHFKNQGIDYKPIEKAYQFAKKAHAWVVRHSWEEYITHPVQVAHYLLQINPDVVSVQVALLHDVIEDTEYTYDDIKNIFSKEVADLCEWLNKVSKVRYSWEDRQLETLKKTFLAMWKDLRVIFVKLADRVHNVQTLVFHPKPEKIERIANETLKIYVPIAQRLGLSIFQEYLENASFRALHTKEFDLIYNQILEKTGKLDFVRLGKTKIENILQQEHIDYISIKWRLKSPYRIWKKLDSKYAGDINQVLDVLAYRVIVNDVASCYSVLWAMHKNYTPIISKIKDYIAIPKANWYKSLHTTLLWMYNLPVEIQIRTQEMDDFAEFWVAAHFWYKEAGWSVKVDNKQTSWVNKLQELVKSYQEFDESKRDNEWFKSNLEIEFLEKNIFAYTPKWDVIELPRGSTLLDFAFRIHSQVWLSYKNWIVNWRIMPIDYVIQTWDIIDIKTYSNKFTASKGWLDVLKTPSAKTKLTKYLKEIEKDEYISSWKNILNEKLKEYWLPSLYSKDDKISSSYKDDAFEKLLLKVADRSLQAIKLVKTHYNIEKQIEKSATSAEQVVLKNNIIVDHNHKLEYTICPECEPKPWDKIIARSWKDWIKIHSVSCKSIKNINFDKLFEALYEWAESTIYDFLLNLDMKNTHWELLHLLQSLDTLNINVDSLNTLSSNEGFTTIELKFSLTNPSKINFILNELQKSQASIKLNSIKIF